MSEIRGDTYIVAYLASFEALRRASEGARARSQDATLSEAERARAGAASIDFDVQLLLLKVAHETLMNEFATPAPPSAEVVERAIGHLTRLSQLVSNSLAAEANLEAVIGVVSALTQLSTKPAPADADADLAAAPAAPADAREALMQGTTTRWLLTVKAASARPR